MLSPKFSVAALAALTLVSGSNHALAWSPKKAPIMTKFAAAVDPAKPLPEYPRPQMVRDRWLNLNGVWEYKVGADGDKAPIGQKLGGEILVPFPVESALSGVMETHDRLWYRRTFTVPKEWGHQRTFLRFGAVDWESEIIVNGQSLGVHKGGYDPFSFDITKALKGDGEQELIVRVYDPTDNYGQPRGKQTLHQGGIMYTPCTGIWQTVWLEPVAEASILDLKLVPDVDNSRLKLTAQTSSDLGASPAKRKPDGAEGALDADDELRVTIKDGDKVVTTFVGTPDLELSIPVENAKLWSPENPFLYDLEIVLLNKGKEIDHIKSYFGMRKIELGEDNGVKKMLLNGKFVFELGPLDQGFWPDGIYTQPTEEALKYDLEMTKKYGFNMIRKHIKVEPQRWYYWCDKMGLLVWQDMPSMNSYIDTGKYKVPPIDKAAFKHELQRMVETHWNSPCIIMWDTFNETQGFHDSVQLVGMVKKLDPSRLVNEDSGGEERGAGDLHDIHPYPPPQLPKPNDWQAIVCGEFGGVGYNVPGHTWTGKGDSYTMVKNPKALIELYARYIAMLKPFRDEGGLSAAVYTQLTDVETELNGLMTYDRITKFDPADVARANHFQYPLPTFDPVVPTSEKQAQTWKYTTNEPSGDWKSANYNDSAWQSGQGGFGHSAPNIKTEWETSDIWLRRHFNPGALTADQLEKLVVKSNHDEDVEVYINGVLALKKTGFVSSYEYSEIEEAGKRAIKPNMDNVMAVHCHQTIGGQFIDVGLSIDAGTKVP